jgi:hypothetical protein
VNVGLQGVLDFAQFLTHINDIGVVALFQRPPKEKTPLDLQIDTLWKEFDDPLSALRKLKDESGGGGNKRSDDGVKPSDMLTEGEVAAHHRR